MDFLEIVSPLLNRILQDEWSIQGTSKKYNLVLEALYDHPEDREDLFNFKAHSNTLHSIDGLNEVLREDVVKLLQEAAEAELKGSGCQLSR